MSYCCRVVVGTAKKSSRSMMRTSGGVVVEEVVVVVVVVLVVVVVVVALVVVGLSGKLLMISTDRPFAFRIRSHLKINGLGATKTALSPFPLLKISTILRSISKLFPPPATPLTRLRKTVSKRYLCSIVKKTSSISWHCRGMSFGLLW